MKLFLGNRTYVGVDLRQLVADYPDRVAMFLGKFLDMHHRELLQPLRPVTCFGAEVKQAFQHLQDGDRLGKVVVTVQGLGDSTCLK